MENREEYERLRKEWEGESPIRIMAKMSLGEVCYNCGSSEAIELHHIVPLRCGGTNNLSNIAVLCHRCHMAVHHGQNIHQYGNKKNSGRPHKVDYETMEKAFSLLIGGKIGRKECKQMIQLADGSHLADMSAFKRFLKEKGIKKLINNIDIMTCQRKRTYGNKELREGDEVGTIIYIDGHEDVIIYKGNSNN